MYKHASINRVYKLVWSHLRRMWVPVPEHKSACAGKQAKRKQHAVLSSLALAMAGALSPGMSNAEPTGGVVTTGSANITSTGNTGAKVTNIKQNNPGVLGLEWSSFNIGRNETVNFIQASDVAVAFNRILDSQGSQILGKINAIGHVWLLNPNGLFFGKDAQVNVGGLVASTLDMANPRGFGIYSQRFTGNSLATVENQGLIAAGFTDPTNSSSKMRGFVALVGNSVKNTGDIKTAEAGQIALAAGSDVNLQFSANSLIGVSVNQNQLNAMAVNGGLMQADGGQVVLTAGAANSALASVVNNTGVMQAKSSAMYSGRIVLSSAAKDGQLNLSGRLDASGINGADGGQISTQASVIRVSDGTGNNTQVVDNKPTDPTPQDNTVAQNLTPDNGGNKTPPNTNNTPTPPRVDNKNDNGNQERKTDKLAVIPTINDLQADQPAKLNSLPSADAQAVNAATRLSSLEGDYWFLDCFFSSSQELKKIRCEPVSQKKSPSIEIKKYPNKKLSALNSPLLP